MRTAAAVPAMVWIMLVAVVVLAAVTAVVVVAVQARRS
jgi:hypothetical protein